MLIHSSTNILFYFVQASVLGLSEIERQIRPQELTIINNTEAHLIVWNATREAKKPHLQVDGPSVSIRSIWVCFTVKENVAQGREEGCFRWMKSRQQGQRCREEEGAYQKWQRDQFVGKDRILKMFSLTVDLSTPLSMLNWQKMGTHQIISLAE